jgi:hypothetical protein
MVVTAHGVYLKWFSSTELHTFSKGPIYSIFTRPLTVDANAKKEIGKQCHMLSCLSSNKALYAVSVPAPAPLQS